MIGGFSGHRTLISNCVVGKLFPVSRMCRGLERIIRKSCSSLLDWERFCCQGLPGTSIHLQSQLRSTVQGSWLIHAMLTLKKEILFEKKIISHVAGGSNAELSSPRRFIVACKKQKIYERLIDP